jgi:hypothetical protein
MMTPPLRLANQLVARPLDVAPGAVVSWFGAMQAQDYLAALWALGLRTRGATERTIEAAIADGSVLRTHVFRGTWQYVAREDVHWMLDLVGARVITSMASRFRELDLDARVLKRCGELFARALQSGTQLTRREMADVLTHGKVKSAGRLIHILGHAELDGVIVSGGRRGKQPTFALLEHRAPRVRRLDRDAALAELAIRYFQSRGPASLRDFVWWTGLPGRDARVAIGNAGKALEQRAADGVTWWWAPRKASRSKAGAAHLLPAFDEYLVGYADRSAVLDARFLKRVNAGGGILKPAVVIDGQVVGTWTRSLAKDRVKVQILPFKPLGTAHRNAADRAIARYGAFLDLSAGNSVKEIDHA